MIHVLFVCMGNICRSPALEAALLHYAKEGGVSEKLSVDSAGLTPYYLGRRADLRICRAAEKKGINIDHVARLFTSDDFQKFDYIFGVTEEVLHLLQQLVTSDAERNKLYLATHFSSRYRDQDISDPFYDGQVAFDHVMEMAEDAAKGLLHYLFS